MARAIQRPMTVIELGSLVLHLQGDGLEFHGVSFLIELIRDTKNTVACRWSDVGYLLILKAPNACSAGEVQEERTRCVRDAISQPYLN